MLSYNNASAFVVAKDSRGTTRFLVITEKDGKINIPSGGKESQDNNDGQMTALRELREETMNGRKETIDMSKLYHMNKQVLIHKNGTITEVHIYYYAEVVSPKYVSIKNNETCGYAWARSDYFAGLVKNDKLNDRDQYDVVAHKFQLRGPCVNTFKRLSHLLRSDII